MHAVDDVIEYAVEDMKTEKRMYVTGINCAEETVIQDFKATLRDRAKNNRIDAKKRVCFHAYQSFAENEVDAETAHNIGVELAKRLWGDRFQVLVATHCNTEHYHNHFVLCAVSFMDGKKYLNQKDDYRRMREESDKLCKEYGLSVIEQPKGKGKNYSERLAEKNGQPTLRGTIREAIDIAIKGSLTRNDFLDAMDKMGFIIDQSGKHAKIKHTGSSRFVRFNSLGEGYSIEEILDRIYKNDVKKYIEIPSQESPKQIFDGESKKVDDMGYTAIYRCYYKALVITKERPLVNRKMYFLVSEDQTRMEKYSAQVALLSEHHINSPKELTSYKEQALGKINEVTELRNDMRNALRRARRQNDLVKISQIKYNIDLYTRQLGKLRREVKACDGIMERVDIIREKLLRIEQEKFRGRENISDEHISRSSRPNRKDEPKRSGNGS